jgi:hypothetical protein
MNLQDSRKGLIARRCQLGQRHVSSCGLIALFIATLVAPAALAQEDTLIKNPIASQQRLPHQIEDNNYLEALARFHATVPRWLPLGSSYHLHTDVRLIDINGNESSATVDHWQKGKLGRDEERAAGWHFTTVWGASQNWSTHVGAPPMRLLNLSDLAPRPGPTERRIRIFAPRNLSMNRRNFDGGPRSCSGEYAGAELCFDTSTGFPVSASVDDELVVYEEWAQFDGATYPSHLALYRGHRLQMEATASVTPIDDLHQDLFAPLPGVAPSSNDLGAYREDPHKILVRSEVKAVPYGDALVKVYVDEKGRVQRADLLDADDKSLGTAAVAAAKHTIYAPQETDGHRVPFETTFSVNNWSTVDPLRVGATRFLTV